MKRDAATLILAGILTCSCHPAMHPAQTPALAGDWKLAELNGKPAPLGAGGHPANLHFDAGAQRVSGFAGCNRLSGSYTLEAPSLTFGPAAMTKMACAEGMDLERDLATALGATTRFEISGDELTLFAEGTAIARFTPGTP